MTDDSANDRRDAVGDVKISDGKPLSIDFRLNIIRLSRFGVVGITSTLLYFFVTAALGSPGFGIDPLVANILGVAASLSVSYFGHHRFTFGARGQHGRYLPRFLFVMTTLFLLSCGVMAVGRYVLNLDHALVTALIAVVFPALSFLVNMLWTFAQKGKGEAN